MAIVRRSQRYYVKNGKRLVDISLGNNTYITLSDKEIDRRIKRRK